MNTKTLYRSTSDKMIGGVCGGLGKYFEIDPTVVRLLFALIFFGFGAGFMIYVLLWIIMPEAKTQSQKLEMSGKPVTLDKLEQAIKRKLPNAEKKIKKASKVPFQFINSLFEALKKVILSIGPILTGLIGGIFIFASVIGIFALTFSFVTILK